MPSENTIVIIIPTAYTGKNQVCQINLSNIKLYPIPQYPITATVAGFSFALQIVIKVFAIWYNKADKKISM